MKTFNWRCLSPRTLRQYVQAAKDFETVTGRFADQADAETIELWRASMVGRKLSNSTIRQRLSAIALIAGLQVSLPKRETINASALLTPEQVRKVMSVVADPDDRLLLVKLLTVGSQARQLTNRNDTFEAHFLGRTSEMSTQAATRRIKRYARKAGLDEKQVSLRAWVLTGRLLIATLKPSELVSVIEPHPEIPSRVQWKPLHGIGRRSAVKA